MNRQLRNKRSFEKKKNFIRRGLDPVVPLEKEAKQIPEGCICQRPKSLVLCKLCGYQMIGRVRTTCGPHPQTIFLMDIERCPNCLGFCTLKEYPN